MQEIVSFSIDVQNKYQEVVDAVKQYFESNQWIVTEEDELNKSKNPYDYESKVRYSRWKEDVQFDPSKSRIYNFGERWKMYQDDYGIINDLPSYISEKVPDCEFTGEKEYSNDEIGVVESADFSYKNGKLTISDTSPEITDDYDIFELYDEGLSVEEISDQTGIDIDDIKGILGIFDDEE